MNELRYALRFCGVMLLLVGIVGFVRAGLGASMIGALGVGLLIASVLVSRRE